VSSIEQMTPQMREAWNRMVMETLAQDFALYVEAELGYSPLTATTYCHNLRHFLDFLEREEVPRTLDSVTTPLVRRWVLDMHSRGLSNTTVGQHLYALRSFWRFLQACGYVDDDRVREVSVPKRDRKLPKYLTADELRRLLDAAQYSRSVYCAFRNCAMITMLVFTGMRRGELLGLRVGDVSLRKRTVTIRGKGNKMRVVPLVDQVIEAVADWLEFRPEDCGHDYLFTTTHGNRIYPSRVQRIWRAILERSGIDKDGVTLHTLRHSMATLLLQSGQCSLVEIQRILGHSRLETTAIYLHVNDGELRDAVEAHPMARRPKTKGEAKFAPGWMP